MSMAEKVRGGLQGFFEELGGGGAGDGGKAAGAGAGVGAEFTPVLISALERMG